MSSSPAAGGVHGFASLGRSQPARNVPCLCIIHHHPPRTECLRHAGTVPWVLHGEKLSIVSAFLLCEGRGIPSPGPGRGLLDGERPQHAVAARRRLARSRRACRSPRQWPCRSRGRRYALHAGRRAVPDGFLCPRSWTSSLLTTPDAGTHVRSRRRDARARMVTFPPRPAGLSSPSRRHNQTARVPSTASTTPCLAISP